MTELPLAAAVGIATFVSIIGGGFYFTGRVVKAVEQLTALTSDHEVRLRAVEQRSHVPVYFNSAEHHAGN